VLVLNLECFQLQYKIFYFVVAYGMVLDRAPREEIGKAIIP